MSRESVNPESSTEDSERARLYEQLDQRIWDVVYPPEYKPIGLSWGCS